MTSAKDYRATIAQESSWVTQTYGDKLGWVAKDSSGNVTEKYLVPEPVVEGMMYLESGGDPGVYDSPDGAVGLMQIEPSGQEASWWAELTGESLPLSHQELEDPTTNIRIAIVGIGKRYEQITGNVPGTTDDWYYAAAAYFGCPVDQNGNFMCAPDAFGTTGLDYFSRVKNYVHTNYDQTVSDFMDKGSWGQEGKGGFGIPGFVLDIIAKGTGTVIGTVGGIIGSGAGAITGVAKDVLNGFLSFAGQYVPRAGIGLLGLIFLGLGLHKLLASGGESSTSVAKPSGVSAKTMSGRIALQKAETS